MPPGWKGNYRYHLNVWTVATYYATPNVTIVVTFNLNVLREGRQFGELLSHCFRVFLGKIHIPTAASFMKNDELGNDEHYYTDTVDFYCFDNI